MKPVLSGQNSEGVSWRMTCANCQRVFGGTGDPRSDGLCRRCRPIGSARPTTMTDVLRRLYQAWHDWTGQRAYSRSRKTPAPSLDTKPLKAMKLGRNT